jgi:hypothetical protein
MGKIIMALRVVELNLFLGHEFPTIAVANSTAKVGVDLPYDMLIYAQCPQGIPYNWSYWKINLPSVSITCNPITRFYDCNEAVGFLTFVIDHYDKPLARKYIFAHAHDRAWHYREDFFEVLGRLRRSEYFHLRKYGAIFPSGRGKEQWGEDAWWGIPLYDFLFKNSSLKQQAFEIGNQWPCCATWFMDSSLVKTRPKEDYIEWRRKLRIWSIRNGDIKPNPAFYCGRVMEWNWHVIFANTSYIPFE